MTERVMPHSLDAERALLGCALIAPTGWPRIASAVRREDFFRRAHQLVFEAMRRLAGDGQPIDPLTVTAELKRRGAIEDVGGPAYVMGLTEGVPTSTNVDAYGTIVRDKSRLRALINEATVVIDAAYQEAGPPQALLDDAIRRIIATAGMERADLITVEEAVHAYADALRSGAAGEAVRCGYYAVDELIGGFRPGDLVLVAARPSVGKTSWALRAAESIARRGQSTLFFSIEMSIEGLSERLLAWGAGVPATTFVRGTATVDQYASVMEAEQSAFAGVPLRIITSVTSVTEMGAWCRRTQQEHGLGCAVVDYLQLLVQDDRQSQEAAIAGISRGLKRLAKDLKIPVVALSQLSRAPESRADKRPQLADLRGSGALDQDCDIALLLFRPEMHTPTPENEGVTEVIVAKHRNGPTGIVRLRFDKDLALFQDYGRE